MKGFLANFFTLSHLLLLSIVAIGLCYVHTFGYFGHFGFDDIHYARLSNLICKGEFALTLDHYTYRWGLIFPQALFFKLFGTNDHAAAITPFLFTMGTCLLVLIFLRNEKWIIKLLALGFLMTSHWVLFYADKIMPDTLVMFFITAMVTVLYRFNFTSYHQKPILMGILFSVLFFGGYISKESIFMIAPWIIYYFVIDLKNRANHVFWISSFLTLCIISVLYHVFIYWQTGHFLQRFKAIEAGSYLNDCSYALMPIELTIKRIGYQLFLLLVRTRDLIGLVFILPFLIIHRSIAFDHHSSKGFIFTTCILFLLCSNFMTVSLTSYNPLCLDPRHYLFLMPILSIATAISIDYWITEKSIRLDLLTLFFSLAMTFISTYNSYESKLVYQLVTIICIIKMIIHWLPNREIYPILLQCMLLATLLLTPRELLIFSTYTGYKTQKRVIFQQFIHTHRSNTLVITNIVQKNFGEYYFGFDTTKVRFVSYKELDKIAFNNYKEIFLLRNSFTESLSGLTTDGIPAYISKSEQDGACIVNENSIKLYKINPNK